MCERYSRDVSGCRVRSKGIGIGADEFVRSGRIIVGIGVLLLGPPAVLPLPGVCGASSISSVGASFGASSLGLVPEEDPEARDRRSSMYSLSRGSRLET